MTSAVLTGGCASKKYVSGQINPVDQRVSQMERKSGEQGKSIEALETDVNKTRERVIDLEANVKQTDAGLKKTTDMAQQAGRNAGQATDAAKAAQQQAADAWAHAENRSNNLQRYVENLENYRVAKTLHVLFGVSRSELDAEAKAGLDSIAKEALSRKKFVFEVQGFTDSQGPAELNLALSQRRAQAVARYLVTTHKIPLRAIYVLGSGSQSPAANNATRDGRRQNRRVEVRLFTPEDGKAAPTAKLE
ncbi:MAG: OmpA family protein [Acidobacteria bacterium]|nr:OmpA family protein [Acidobacteriota bacterium]